MDHSPETRPQGALSALLVDQDLSHLERVLGRSLAGDFGGPILPLAYWRNRLAAITRSTHLSHTQLQTVHRLYLKIDGYETAQRPPGASAPEQAASLQEPPLTA
jgi:hypothetical protein